MSEVNIEISPFYVLKQPDLVYVSRRGLDQLHAGITILHIIGSARS